MLYLQKLWTAFLKVILISLIGIYRTIGTTFLGGTCRFYPSCSDYAQQCLHQHNTPSAIILIFKRLIKCYPGSSHFGYDPVPEKTQQEVAHAK